MAIRTKVRSKSRVAVASRPARSARSSRELKHNPKLRELKPIKREIRREAHAVARKTIPFADGKPAVPGPGHSFNKAMRYLDTLTHFERLRIVRYNSQNFDLDRMRTLLKKMGN